MSKHDVLAFHQQKIIETYIQMSRPPTSPERCNTADTTNSDDPLDGKPSEDAKLTHVDSCSSLPDAGDDLVPCDRRNSTFTYQQPGRMDELGNDTLIQLLANASALLTSQDLALPPNDPRVFLPTPFAPGQSARTLLEQELQRKREQEMKEWNALLQTKNTLSSQAAATASKKPSVVVQPQSVMTQTQMLLQNSPVVMQQQLQLGRGQPHSIAATGISAAAAATVGHQPFTQQQLHPQSILQQQHLLTLQQQLSGSLFNPHQINPMQRIYAPNAQPLSFQQHNMNDVPMAALMGVGVGGMGLSQFTMVNNLMHGMVPSMHIPNHVASARALGVDATGMGLSWLLQQQQFRQSQIPPVSTTHLQTLQRGEAPKEQAATKPAAKQKEKGKADNEPHQNRWTQRYNELVEYKRVEGVSCLYSYLLSL
jgi:hypothetical protein